MPINYLINGQVIDLFVIHIMEIKVIYLIWKEIQNIYIYNIELNVKQFFSCQLCFQSYRVHRDKVDAIQIIHFNGKEEEEIEIYIYYHF